MVVPGLVPAVVEGCHLLYRAVTGNGSPNDCCRTCTIEIRNHNPRLEFLQPEYYLYSGVSAIPPEPVIAPNAQASCTFRKTFNSTYGTSGLITYAIRVLPEGPSSSTTHLPPLPPCHGEKKEASDGQPQQPCASCPVEGCHLVMMWSVPMFGQTVHALGIERPPHVTKSALYNKMCYEEVKPWFKRELPGTCVRYEDTINEVPISLLGSISDAGHATWTVDIE